MKKDPDKIQNQLNVSEPEQNLEEKVNQPDKREAEFVFAGGYSEERTEEEIQKEDLPLDKTGQPPITNSKLTENFEHECTLHQDSKKDLNNSEKEK